MDMMKFGPILIPVLLLPGCGGSAIDPGSEPRTLAREAVTSQPPEAIARSLVDWLEDADTAHKDFARAYSSQILSVYDSLGCPDSSRRFTAAFDGARRSLSHPRQVHLMLVLSSPSALGTLLARSSRDSVLVAETREQLQDNPGALRQFNEAYSSTLLFRRYEDNGHLHSLD